MLLDIHSAGQKGCQVTSFQVVLASTGNVVLRRTPNAPTWKQRVDRSFPLPMSFPMRFPVQLARVLRVSASAMILT